MRKRLLSIIAGSAIILSACEERGPAIDFSNVEKVDTTYVIAPEAPEARRVLIEEATGVKCPNCPAGAKILKQADSTNPGRIVIIGLHAGIQTSPLSESKYDLRDSTIMNLFAYFGGEPNKPAAVFDRTVQNGKYFLDNRTAWPGLINQRLAEPTPVRLSMTSSYDAATHEATIRVRVSYTTAVSKPQSIGVVIVEDDIEDPQEDGLTIIEDYVHQHVHRAFVTPINGSSFLDSLATKDAGRVFERTFTYKLPDAALVQGLKQWNVDNLHAVAYVFNNAGADQEVQQAAHVKLK